MGGKAMIFDEFVDEVAILIESMTPRSKAAAFWLLGSGLAESLEPSGDWADWFVEARDIGKRYVVTGEVGQRAQAVWAEAQAATDDNVSQLMNSAILCLSTPVGIALNSSLQVGSWVEHAFFPSIQRASLDLFGDVAFPDDDDDVDAAFEQPVVQAAVDYCRRILAILADAPALDDSQLEQLLEGADVLAHDC